jgi:hypothetical protein
MARLVNPGRLLCAGGSSSRPVRHIVGTAAIFGKWHTPAAAPPYPPHTRILLHPGCFDQALRLVRLRKKAVLLTLGHRGRVIGSTGGGLELFVVGDKLQISIHPCLRRDVMREIRACGYEDLSIGLGRCEGISMPCGVTGLVVVTSADLREVSIVRRAGNAGCRLTY